MYASFDHGFTELLQEFDSAQDEIIAKLVYILGTLGGKEYMHESGLADVLTQGGSFDNVVENLDAEHFVSFVTRNLET